ncbi:MAG: YqhA family protein [Synechococcaceae cyanobacterium]|nr:YqhA family protein [Synechococcaceae cyanobacterium]
MVATRMRSGLRRLEQPMERWLWRFRLVAILPVVMSLASTGVTFVLGTMEIGRAMLGLGSPTGPEKVYMARLLGGVVTGIDLYLIGIALLIFGYGVYELLISPSEAAHRGGSGSGLLDIRNLDQLKEKLVKVLVVALIVAAFKAMLTLPIENGPSLAFFCLSVLLLAISGFLITGEGRSPLLPTGEHRDA